MEKSKYAYGIDFGTTNSTITAINKSGEPIRLEIDEDAENKAVMRSVIYINNRHEFTYGQKAIATYVKDIAEGKVAKRKSIFTGKYIKISSPADAGGFKKDQIVPEIIEIEEGDGGRLIQALKSVLSSKFISNLRIFEKEYSIEELVFYFLKEMKHRADNIVGENITDVVLGRPVQFVGGNNEIAITRLKKAAKMAGFKNVVFEYEPVGAAYDYGIDVHDNQIALMFDFGGGTLDLTLMKFPEKKVIINTGIPLGGDYINSEIFVERVAEYFGSDATYGDKKLSVPHSIFEKLKSWYTISLLKTESFANTLESLRYKHSKPETLKALSSLVYDNLGFSLYEEIDRLKKSLSKKDKEVLSLTSKEININEGVTRKELEDLIANDLVNIEELIERTLREADIQSSDVDVVATTGGSSLIPVVNQLLINKFGKEKMKNTDAFTSVSTGLALRAYEEFLS